jgi:hypothetical protein
VIAISEALAFVAEAVDVILIGPQDALIATIALVGTIDPTFAEIPGLIETDQRLTEQEVAGSQTMIAGEMKKEIVMLRHGVAETLIHCTCQGTFCLTTERHIKRKALARLNQNREVVIEEAAVPRLISGAMTSLIQTRRSRRTRMKMLRRKQKAALRARTQTKAHRRRTLARTVTAETNRRTAAAAKTAVLNRGRSAQKLLEHRA